MWLDQAQATPPKENPPVTGSVTGVILRNRKPKFSLLAVVFLPISTHIIAQVQENVNNKDLVPSASFYRWCDERKRYQAHSRN